MGVVVFWILFWLLIITLIVSTVQRDRRNKAARIDALLEGFGSFDNTVYDCNLFDDKPYLYEHLKKALPDDFWIDDITVGDLALRDVYSRMNRCITNAGEDVLYCMFRDLPPSEETGHAFYDKIEDFLNEPAKVEECIRILDAYGMRKQTDDLDLIRSTADARESGIVFDVLPVLLLIASIGVTAFYPMPGFILMIAVIIFGIGTYFSGKHKMDMHLRGLCLALHLIRCANALSSKGYSDLAKYDRLADLTKFDHLISYKVGTTSNPFSLLFDYVRMITHVDIVVYKLRLARIRESIDELTDMYIEIGKVDAAIATASYIRNRKHCRASLSGNKCVNAMGMYHPLVRKPVPNDITANRSVLLTGSNASGKSTFLKSVGLNTIFARSFGFALADSFECGITKIYSSMALRDDIIGARSYYVVEAESIKRICDAASEGAGNILVIIDEVLRGTNTIERIAASARILKYLCDRNVLMFAATHDRELCDLLSDDMDLYFFTEEIHEDNVTFPYVIQKGRSDTTNAIRLLSMLGFDDRLVSSADDLVAHYKQTGNWI